MKVIMPSKVNGTVTAPPSKSATIRAIAASLLADGVSEITNPSFCDDAVAAFSIAESLGAAVRGWKDLIFVSGTDGFKNGYAQPGFINCNESGLCIRMFPPIAAIAGGEHIFNGKGTLKKRPVRMLESLHDFGVVCKTHNGFPPILVNGRIKGSSFAVIDGSSSSQFLTGLLMSLPLADSNSRILAPNLVSKSYVVLTIDMVRRYGIDIVHDETLTEFTVRGGQRYRHSSVLIEGDWSGASFFLVAGAIAGSASVAGLDINSNQADRAILEALREVGANVRIEGPMVTVQKNDLKAFSFNAEECPDLVPPLAALATHCSGTSTIYGTKNLKHKESDRATVIASRFGTMGISVDTFPDRMEIHGGKPRESVIDPAGDHRIAMACAVAALNGEGQIGITNEGCVAKSYSNFFQDLTSIREKT